MRPRRVSDEDILEAARTCLLQHGTAVSIDKIAQCLGVSGPAVLKRFGTKERLVTRALLSDEPPDLSGGPESGPLRPQLIAILEQANQLVGSAAPRLATLRAGNVKASQVAAHPHPQRARENLQKWLEKARQSHGLTHPDLTTAADLLISLVEARAFMEWIDPEWGKPQHAWAPRAIEAIFGDLEAGAARSRSPAAKKKPAKRSARR